MKQTLLVLGAGVLQMPAITTGRQMGLRVVVLDGSPSAPGLHLGDVGRVVNIADADACLAVAKQENINGVVHICSEVSLHVLGRINDELGLHGIGQAVAIQATNKEKMRRAFEGGGAPSPKSFGATTENEALHAADNLRWPVIIKPSRNSGSRGIARLDRQDDRVAFLAAFHRAVKESRDRGAVVEEFVEGPEFSVEILVWSGKPHVLAVTDKVTTGAPNFVETGHSQPSRFGESDLKQVEEAAIRGVKALGIDWSAAHAEVRLSARGAFLMEIGARLGGDFITTELVPRSTGIIMVAGAINLALGKEPDLVPAHPPQGAAIRYFTPVPGKIRTIHGVEESRSMPGVRVLNLDIKEGDLVPEISSSLSRVGYVIAEGATANEAIARAESARDKVQIKL